MKTRVNAIISSLQETLGGQPWYGKPIYNILEETDPSVTNVATGDHPHTALALVYHMLTWTEFTLARVRGEKIDDMQKFESLDWREIDPQIHGWEEALVLFKTTNNELLLALETFTDEDLSRTVDYRDYNFDQLLNGIIQHHIYHAAQVNFINKSHTTGIIP